MKKLMVCLSFDFDAMSGLVARGLTTPTPVSRGEFGAVAVPRILRLLQKYDIPSTFFIPGVVIETYPETCESIVAENHEIGNHGWTHQPPATLSRDKEEEGLVRANEAIRRLSGRVPSGYRSPSWDLSANTLELLEQYGFQYESSMMGNDYEPYYARLGDEVYEDAPMKFGMESSIVEMPISWSLDDFPHFEFLRLPTSVTPGLMNANDVLDNWLGDFEYMHQSCDWGVLTYTCHPYVIGRGHRMLMLERLILKLIEKGAEFVTMEVAMQAFREREPR